MSIKRQATTDLNHENWDQDDPSQHEEMGSFKTASKDILEKRVIRTAKRRTQASDDEPKKSVFSGFGGFNKAPPSSFDFLSNLTNGNKDSNGSPVAKSDTSVTPSPFGSKVTSSPAMFNMPATSSLPTAKLTFGPSSQSSSLFGGSSTTTGQSSPFTASKSESTVTDSPFKIQATSSSSVTTDTKSKTTNAFQVSPTMFGIPSSNTNSKKSLFSNNTSDSTFKIPSVSSNSTVQPNFVITSKTISNESDKTDGKGDDKKMVYYSKLKGLNESVSDWIKKHVEETPLCILSPIFKDYEKYLKEIQEEYHGNEETTKKSNDTVADKQSSSASSTNTVSGFASSDPGVSLLNNKSCTSPKSEFHNQNIAAPAQEKPPGFSFGIKPVISNSSSSSNTMNSAGGEFSFGFKTSTPKPTATTSSPFSLATNTTSNAKGTTPFSFGIGKPFSFNANVQKPVEPTTESNEDEDEPPKVEFTPVVEENSVFDKRCKIFVKKDGNFVDKGVGTLYIKKIEESGKHQLLVRANTNLGNVLVNLILTSAIPTQRLGKNNVMLVCIPTQDAKPPPTPVLIRVKTSEEADELLEILNKFKV